MSSPDSEQSEWFAIEVLPHEAALRAYLRGRFPKLAGHVDDLVQDAYVRILRARQSGAVTKPRAYLFMIARNAAIDLCRRDRSVSIDELVENAALNVVEERPDAAEAASHEQEIEIVSDAIRALPPRCREIFVLRRHQGLSYRDIASRLEISEATVNAQLAVAMLRCREYLRAHGVLKKAAPSADVCKQSQ